MDVVSKERSDLEPQELRRAGYHLIDGYLDPRACMQFLGWIGEFRQAHELEEIHRPEKRRSLRYHVINGDQIREGLPEIWKLYRGALMEAIRQLYPASWSPIENTKAGINVNVMRPGASEYRWHYDRNRLTAILYLNGVEGGETVLYPNYRILLRDGRHPLFQQRLDALLHLAILRRIFGRKQVIRPEAGRLAVILGDRCWHSVRPVVGTEERVNIIAAYDLPGARHRVEEELDSYLYTRKPGGTSDPNYG